MADALDKMINATDGDDPNATKEAAEEYVPVYRVYEDTKIPVSKATCTLWYQRWCQGKARMEKIMQAWDEAIAYYKNDQTNREGRGSRMDGLQDEWYETENIVFANVSALVPTVYAKNPEVTVTDAQGGENEEIAAYYETFLDALLARQTKPGVNIKPKARRAVVLAMLTNTAYFEIGYTKKEDSSEAALTELQTLSEELAKAKNESEVREIEGKLMAIDEKVSLLSPPGPWVRSRRPHDIIVDDDACEPDLSDSNYIFISDKLSTNYIRAVYGKKNENGEYASIYQPTHILSASAQGDNKGNEVDREIASFNMLRSNDEYSKFGFNSREEFDNACLTKVWYVWDRITRRVLMFNEQDWSWPIWVWDDPYNLSQFYPVYAMSFYTDPEDVWARSEVMYYMDQQDEINRINMEQARMRWWISHKVFANADIIGDQSTIEAFLSTKSKHFVQTVKLPEGAKGSDVLFGIPAPSTAAVQLFDKTQQLQAIDRLSSVTPMLKGVEYKTNTTNKAIESYESSTQTRLDEKIDAIEDILGRVAWGLLELCVQFMDQKAVATLCGERMAQNWTNMDVKELNERFNFSVVGGSTLKPTSKTKKEQAAQLGQVLGQFAGASPAVVIVMLKMLQRAFGEDVVITKDEWNFILESIQAAAQQGNTSPAGGAESGNVPGGGGNPPAATGGNDQLKQAIGMVSEVLQQLPPEIVQQIGQALSSGQSLIDVVGGIIQQLQQQGAPTGGR